MPNAHANPGVPPAAGRPAPLRPAKPSDTRMPDRSNPDPVDIASRDSFPASDPPSWAAPRHD